LLLHHRLRGARRRPVRARAKGGFTLTELAAILVVLALLAGLAVPSLSGLSASRADVALTRIRNVLIFAEEWTLATGNDTWVSFDVTNELVSAFVEDPANPGKAGRLTLADPLTRSALSLQLGADGIGLESADFGGTSEVQFDPSGVPCNSSGAVLSADGTVSITGGATVRVTRQTGLVTID
jgi:Tfp pilus assembly protein FimT